MTTPVITRTAARRASRRSTAPAGLRVIPGADDADLADVEFHVYGLSIGGEVLGLGDRYTDSLEPYVCLGMPAVRAAIATRRKGWDVAGEWLTHADSQAPVMHADCAGVDCDGGHLVQTIQLPSLMPVAAWRVVNTVTGHAETWYLTADGPLPETRLY